MNRDLAEFLFSNKAKSVSANALFVYVLMRADVAIKKTAGAKALHKGKLVTGLSPSDCVMYLDMKSTEIEEYFTELVTQGWIEEWCNLYIVGTMTLEDNICWCIDEKINVKSKYSSLIKDKVKHDERVFTPVTEIWKEEKIKHSPEELTKLVDRVTHYFVQVYFTTYDKFPPHWEDVAQRPKFRVFVRRFVLQLERDENECYSLIEWIFTHWAQLQKVLNSYNADCQFQLLGTKKVIIKLRAWKTNGIPVKKGQEIADRAAIAALTKEETGW